MATIRPSTRTPGSLKILYKKGLVAHRLSVNLLANIDINDFAARRADAINLAGKIQGVMPASVELSSWALYTRPNTNQPPTLIYAEALTGPFIGVAPAIVQTPDTNSHTVTVTGTGTPGQPDWAVGAMRLVLFNGNAMSIVLGEKVRASNALTPVTGWNALLTDLAASNHYWADFYGQKGTLHQLMPVQFNAHTQRVNGT